MSNHRITYDVDEQASLAECREMGIFRAKCRKDNFCLYVADQVASAGIELLYSDIAQLRAALDVVERYVKQQRRATLLDDVQAYRVQHPKHGRRTIAKALIDKYGTIDIADRGREIEALAKHIERVEKRANTEPTVDLDISSPVGQ